MDCGDHPRFASHEEEILYWKNFVERLMNEKETLQREFDDYCSDSQQLEKEYEASIEQNEKTIRDLQSSTLKLQNENESLKLKLEQSNHESAQLHNDVETLRAEKVQFLKTVRVLEQKNDDLERMERMITESMATSEASLNQVIERNAILESEIEEKEVLKMKLQRLHDEARDLKQELVVKERIPDNERILNGVTKNGVMDSNRLKVEIETQTTPIKRDLTKTPNSVLDRPFTPSSRMLALNIISELMRKIGLSRYLCDHCGRMKCTTLCPSPTRP